MSIAQPLTGNRTVSPHEIRARAEALIPMLQAASPKAEELRRLQDESVQAMRETGMFRALVPERFGGYQFDLRSAFDIFTEAGRACGSAGWISMILGTCNWLASLFPEQAVRDVFEKNPDACVAGVFGARGTSFETVEGGYRVSGLWPFCSGCHHAQWMLLGAPAKNEKGEVVDELMFMFPASDVVINDDWKVTGLRATGSNSVSAKGVFVPQHRAVSMGALAVGKSPNEHATGISLYRAPFVPWLAVVLVAPMLGMAKAALAHFKARLPQRGIVYTTYTQQGAAPVTHLQMGEAAVKYEAAEALTYRVIDEIAQVAEKNEPLSIERRARIRADAAFAARLLLESVEVLFMASGGSAIAENNPIQRIARDMHAANLHGVINLATNLETYGRVLAGMEPNTHLL
jgi:3-hydroxy-9,10-secoandrosta-1,3,5(10)-triene-9,17-dione monooxygenase